jgi:hypothetical protein
VNSILDYSLVGLALLVSAGYAASSLGPRGLRTRLLAVCARCLRQVPAFGLPRLAKRLENAATAKAGACGGCDNCGSEKAHTATPAETRIPMAKIGRRF